MLDKVVFFNFAHNGDAHVSRDFVKFAIKNVPAKKYFYIHFNVSGRLLLDISDLDFISSNAYKEKSINLGMDGPVDFIGSADSFLENNSLYINCWYIAFKFKHFNRCGGTTIETLYNSFKESLELVNVKLIKDRVFYLPSIDFKYYETKKIDDFFKDKKEKFVFISDGDSLSGQSQNFSFQQIIIDLANANKDISFITTNSFIEGVENIYNVSNISGTNNNSNLNECAYVSTFCNVIVGRGSGPFTFSLHKQNLFDKRKKYIAFVNSSGSATGDIPKLLACRESASFIHSNIYDSGNVFNTINDNIK